MNRIIGRLTLALLCSCTVLPFTVSAQNASHRTFAASHDAVQALIAAVKSGNLEELFTIFGPDSEALIASSDPATARRNREVFAVAVAEQWRLVDETPTRKTLVIGNEDWPFPVPIVKVGSGWQFDTAAGKEEIIARRIGRNELEVIQTCLAYVTAQKRYAEQGHDGNAAGVCAMKFGSDAGKENGLLAGRKGQKRSPLGDLVAQAAAEGSPRGANREQPTAFHGYYFKILTAQGAAAPGGAKNYIVKGAMTQGFALVAWPAQYDVTGVMTFVVNHDGIVFEKDLGTGTDAAARKMTSHNPDASWRRSQ